jgi:hypothetical protein
MHRICAAIDRAVPQKTYLCTSPVTGPSDRHNIQTSAKNPTAIKNLGFLAACVNCREGGRRALAAFHEYPFPSSMSSDVDVPLCVVSSSPSLACEMRTDILRSRRLLSVSLRSRFRWTCRVEDLGGGESSFAVGGAGAQDFSTTCAARDVAEGSSSSRCGRSDSVL